MYIVHVYICVKKDRIGDFINATLENARNSNMEEGIQRFEVVQQQDDPARFALLENYYTPEDQLKHRETAHYKKWKTETADMIEGEYTRRLYQNVE